jgi:TonB family protein
VGERVYESEAEADFHPAPVLPPELRGFQGSVRVRVKVDTEGRVEDVEIVRSSGDREVDRAALRAVRRWEYASAIHEGRPVTAVVDEILEF